MGGRGSAFKSNPIETLIDILNKESREDSNKYLDFGDVNSEISISKATYLTKKLKNDNIIVCDSISALSEDVSDLSLRQIQKLTEKYSSIATDFLDQNDLKVRAYKMNQVDILTGRKTAELKTAAIFQSNTSQICLNTRSFSDFMKPEKNEYIITHEYGHFIQDCIIEKRLKQDVKQYSKYKTDNESREALRRSEARSITLEILNIAQKDFGAKRDRDVFVSAYAETNDFEYFAELFTKTNQSKEQSIMTNAMNKFLHKEANL